MYNQSDYIYVACIATWYFVCLAHLLCPWVQGFPEVLGGLVDLHNLYRASLGDQGPQDHHGLLALLYGPVVHLGLVTL